ncbi:hypothetical protein V8Z80_15700 [Orrella sp. JC864]|uniref:hypothetical protein n=1 Tax=Orrella sp. JC864 TaxID=3120298 RepID=UPI0030083DD0
MNIDDVDNQPSLETVLSTAALYGLVAVLLRRWWRKQQPMVNGRPDARLLRRRH